MSNLNVQFCEDTANNAWDSLRSVLEMGIELPEASLELYEDLSKEIGRYMLDTGASTPGDIQHSYNLLQRQLAEVVNNHEAN